MFDLNQVYTVNEFLSESEWNIYAIESERYSWQFNAFSHNPNDRVFWKKDFWSDAGIKCDSIENIFRNKIENLFNIKGYTQSLYLNAQAHGQCGSFHTDIDKKSVGNYITMVYFPLQEWKPEWGGFTVVIDNKNDMHVIYPKPNSAVIFNSKFDHLGMEPTVHCNKQRVSLAHKLKF